MVFNLLFPRRGRLHLQKVIDESHALLMTQCAASKDLVELVELIQDASVRQVKELLPILVPAVAGGMVPCSC